jgi:hypothetical protein
MKARVPSIGSSTQRSRASGCSSSYSSPRMPHSGHSRRNTARIAISALRSATVTGEWSAFRSAGMAERKNGRMTSAAASAAATAAAT